MEIEVGHISELQPGSATVVAVGDLEIAVFNTGRGLFAVDNRCVHRGGPISRGLVAKGIVTCPWHWWRYELATGDHLGSERVSLQTYPVHVRDHVIVVDAPPQPEKPSSMRDRLLRHAVEWSRDR